MSYTGYRHGALAVLESAHPKELIERLLKRLDQRLFLERQMTLDQERVWCVVIDLGQEGLHTILEWRDTAGEPIDYPTERIVSEIQRMMQRGPVTMESIDRRNAELREKRRAEAREQYRELALDYHRVMAPGHSALLPRGVALRMSRDKQRAAGRNV